MSDFLTPAGVRCLVHKTHAEKDEPCWGCENDARAISDRMKKRSEVAAMKKRSEVQAPKPSAEERTVPLPIDEPEGSLHCDACEEDVSTKDVIRNAGKIECPNCGASIESLATPTKLSPPAGKPADNAPSNRSDVNDQVFVDKHPDRKWCGECGTELTIILKGAMAGVNFPCGHGNAERVDDPRKAKTLKPVAALQTRTYVEVDKRNAEDAKKVQENPVLGPETDNVRGVSIMPSSKPKNDGREIGGLNSSPPMPKITIEGDRISAAWGKSTFPLAMMSNFTVGEFFVSKVLAPGEDRVKASREILDDLEKIADEAFDRQRAWYEKRLAALNE